MVENKGSAMHHPLDCMYMTSDDGYLVVEGTEQTAEPTTCGIYVIKAPEEVVEVEVDQMDVSCEAGGLINVSDYQPISSLIQVVVDIIWLASKSC